MKITSVYYLQYPDNSPSDPQDADSEVRVEVGQGDASIDHFDCCYSLRVLTLKRLTTLLRQFVWVLGLDRDSRC